MSFLLSLLGLIPGVLNVITTWQKNAFDAKVSMFVATTGATKEVAVATLQGQAAVQTKWWFAALPPALIGFAIACFVIKAVVYDKVIGSFVGCSGNPPAGTCITFATDPMTGDLRWLFTAVIASYFGYAIVDRLKR